MIDETKIDEIDAKILKMLLAESRTSFTDIAEECKITVTSVRMRYKRLWKDGVVNGEEMLVNPHCLGYRHIIDLGIMNAVENEKEVAKFLESKPYISDVVGPLGKYNFLGKVALRDLNMLGETIEDLESNHKIKHVDALIWAEAANIEYPQNLIIKPLDRENERKNNHISTLTNHDQAPLEIDEIDRKIAKILSEKSRTPFSQIAEQLHMSTKTVIRRYKKLRENLLTLSTISLDLNKLGYTALANLYIKVSNRSKMPEIYSQLLQIPNLIVIIRLIGSYDLYSAIALEDFEKMFEANEKIRTITGIETTDVFLTRMLPSWPLNLFPSLLEHESMQPKYWPTEPQK
ncbi:MAG: Lrp/AsnC family transcriptional regulator [Candidatus Bathyarchaeia archaeon]